MEQSLEIRAREIQDLSLTEKQEKALGAISEFNLLARRTVKQGWLAGKYLTAIKSELGHRNWLPWLRDNGIEPRTAQRFMKLATVEIRQIVAFDSMSAALESLKPGPLAKLEELARERAEHAWKAGRAMTKIVELTSERELREFLKENDIGRGEATAYRDIYERHSLEGITELPVEDLEALVS